MFKNILVAVDGSESNHVAVDTAITLAKENGAKLTAITVFDPRGYGNPVAGSDVTSDSAYLEQISEASLEYIRSATAEAGMELASEITMGDPSEKIVEASANYDLVICGTLGRTGLNRLVMGSVAERVVRLSKCPVLVCRK